MLRQKITVQVTTLPDCDDTRFDGTFVTAQIILKALSSEMDPTKIRLSPLRALGYNVQGLANAQWKNLLSIANCGINFF